MKKKTTYKIITAIFTAVFTAVLPLTIRKETAKAETQTTLTAFVLDDLNFNVLTGLNFYVRDSGNNDYVIPYNFNSYSNGIDYDYNGDFLLTINNAEYKYIINTETIKELTFKGSNLLLSHNQLFLNAKFRNSFDLSFNFDIEYLSGVYINEDYTIDIQYDHLTLPYNFFRSANEDISIADCLYYCINNNLIPYTYGKGYAIGIYQNGLKINTFYNTYLVCATATFKIGIPSNNTLTTITSSGLAYDEEIASMYRGNMRGIYSWISTQLTGADVQEAYGIGFNDGYVRGVDDTIENTNTPLMFLKNLFNTVWDIINIKIFGFFSIGSILLFIIILSVISLIFKLIKG